MDDARENHRGWLGAIVLGVAIVAAYFLVGDLGGGLAAAIVYDLTGPLTCVAILVGARRNRSSDMLSWVLLAGGVALFAAGDGIWGYYEFARNVETPFPSVGDAFYVAGYPLIVAAFVRLARARVHDRGAMVDAVVVGIASGVFIWFSFLASTLGDGAVPFWHRLVAAAYPAMDVPILAAAALFLLTPGARSAVYWWLIAGVVLMIGADIGYARSVAIDDYSGGGLLDAFWLLSYACWAVAALHPSMASLSHRQVGLPTTLTLRRLMIQSVAIVGVPFLIFLDADGHGLVDYAILIGAVALLLGLNLSRLGGLIRASENAAATLRAEEARYRALVEQMPAVVYTQAPGDSAPTLYVNSHTERLFGYSRDTWQADAGLWQRLLHPEDLDRVTAADHEAEVTGRPYREEYRMCTHDGRTVWVREEAVLVHGEDGEPDYWQGISIDITAEKEAEAALVATVDQFRLLFDANPHPMWVYELGTLRFLAVNDAAVDHYGYSRGEFLGMTLFDLRSPEEAVALVANLGAGRPDLEHAGVWTHRIKDGREIKVEITSHTLPFDGRDAALVVARDVTDHLALQDQLAHQAFHDPLTGLPNRLLFSNRLEHALARTGRTADPLAVLFVDLDGFKAVNDSLGHAAGDDLLLVVARRLGECIRAGDTVGRLGGDEFILLLEYADARRATEVAERIGRRLAAPIELQGRAVHVTASVGIACKSSPLDSVDDLLRNADVAMYAAKLRGKAQYATFDAEMHRSAWDRLELEEELRRAILHGEFRVFYQPILDLASGHATEVEALVRWQHPERGLIGPAEFIPLAEETGLILPIGWWVLAEACRQVRSWHLANPDEPPLLVAVNLSPRMFEHPSLVEEVRRILNETGLDPHLLRLEITEGVMMAEGDGPARTLAQLKGLGVRLAIDDFGTGYSSLAYLQQLPIDILKIDRGFISRMGQDDESMEIVRLIIGLAKTLGLDVVGEGIETVEQLASLRSLGGDRGQGFLFAHPMSAEDAGSHLFHEDADAPRALEAAVVS